MSRAHASSFAAHHQQEPFKNERSHEIIKLNNSQQTYSTRVDNLKAKLNESLGFERSFSSFRTTLKDKLNKPPRPPPPQTSNSTSYSRINNNKSHNSDSSFQKSVSSYSKVERKELNNVLGEDECLNPSFISL